MKCRKYKCLNLHTYASTMFLCLSVRLEAAVASGRVVAWAPALSISTLETEPQVGRQLIRPSTQTSSFVGLVSLSPNDNQQHYQTALASTVHSALKNLTQRPLHSYIQTQRHCHQTLMLLIDSVVSHSQIIVFLYDAPNVDFVSMPPECGS